MKSYVSNISSVSWSKSYLFTLVTIELSGRVVPLCYYVGVHLYFHEMKVGVNEVMRPCTNESSLRERSVPQIGGRDVYCTCKTVDVPLFH